MVPRAAHQLVSAVIAAIAIAVAGCNPPEPIPARHTLTGVVLRKGLPVTAGGLIFLPVGRSSGLVVNAHVNADGTFTAETTRTRPAGGVDVFPGVAPGDYKVIYHPPSDGQKMGLEVELPDVVTVEAKTNQITLVLPEKLPEGKGLPRDDDPKSPIFNPNPGPDK